MTAEALTRFVNNDKPLYDAVTRGIRRLRAEVDRAANRLAQENAAWHDDPEAEDHAAFHAPADEQFPRAVRDEAIRDLVAYYLSEWAIQEEAKP